jgi:hypothetical protein
MDILQSVVNMSRGPVNSVFKGIIFIAVFIAAVIIAPLFNGLF